MQEATITTAGEPRLGLAAPEDDAEFTRSVYRLLRHYARTRTHEPALATALRDSGVDLGALAARGLLLESVSEPEGATWRALIRAQPDLWWLDLEFGVHATQELARGLPGDTVDRLRRHCLALVAHLDRGARPAAWETAADVFSFLIGDAESLDAEENLSRARVLARGVGLTIQMSPDWLAPALAFVGAGPSRALLRAMVRDQCLLEQDRWLGALLLRGGPRSIAAAAASMMFAPRATVTRLRSLLSIAPAAAMIRVAEAHGLLTLAGPDGQEAAEALRTAFLTQAWQATDLSGLPWARAFRGEVLVARCLPELADTAAPLAREVCLGLPRLLGEDAGSDPARHDAIATCLARLLQEEPTYDAALRVAEAHVRELGRRSGAQAQAVAMRSYALTLVSTARLLMRRSGTREQALSLYARVLRLRKAHPEMLPRDVFPDTLEGALHIADPDRAARRWLTREVAATDAPRAPGPAVPPTAEDPLPAANEIVATADGLMPLPAPFAAWVGAKSWSPARLLGLLLPLPFRHVAAMILRTFGLTAKARFVLSDDGRGMMAITRRVLGFRVRTSRRAIAGGCLFTFPEGSPRADRLLGRWAALLILTSTLGTWVLLSGVSGAAPFGSTVLGSLLLVTGLVGYAGALWLQRIVGGGYAVAVQDTDGHVSVWQIDAATRYLITQLMAQPSPSGEAEMVRPSEGAPGPLIDTLDAGIPAPVA